MRFIFCALVIALAGMPGVLGAAQSSNQEMSRQLDALERRIDRLERREKAETRSERRSDAKAAAAAKAGPTSADWRQVKLGMPEEQVKTILGNPVRITKNREHQIWSWHAPTEPTAEVWMRDGVADRIHAPK